MWWISESGLGSSGSGVGKEAGRVPDEGRPDSGHAAAVTGSIQLEDTGGRSGGVQEISGDTAVAAFTTGPGTATPRAVAGSGADYVGGLEVPP